MKRIFLTLFIASLSLAAFSQNITGVTYKTTFSGDGIGAYASMMPTATKLSFHDGKILTQIQGGMTAAIVGDILTIPDQKVTYYIIHSEKKAYKTKMDESQEDAKVDYTVTKTKETATILGYKCTKYKITTKGADGKESVMYLWTTTEIANAKPSGKHAGNGLFKDGVEGFTLKMEMNGDMNGQKYGMVNTATEVSKEALKASDFEVPSGYTIVEGLPAMLEMMKSMGGGQ